MSREYYASPPDAGNLSLATEDTFTFDSGQVVAHVFVAQAFTGAIKVKFNATATATNWDAEVHAGNPFVRSPEGLMVVKTVSLIASAAATYGTDFVVQGIPANRQ